MEGRSAAITRKCSQYALLLYFVLIIVAFSTLVHKNDNFDIYKTINSVWSHSTYHLRWRDSTTYLAPHHMFWNSGRQLVSTYTVSYFQSSNSTCKVNRRYHQSDLEKKWYKIIDSIADNTKQWKRGCDVIREDADKINQLMAYHDKWNIDTSIKWDLQWMNDSILSYFEVEEDCGNGAVVEYVPMEPLIGFLRHPKTICLDPSTDIVDKGYMFLLNSLLVFPSAKRNHLTTKYYLFDLGASLYAEGFGGASQKWFVDEYRSRGIEFDRILCWEGTQKKPTSIYDSYPKDVVDKVSYYNVLAEQDLDAKMSPVRMIKALVKPHDFLVLKIDIDNDPVELSIVQSFIDDPTITNLIDEFFFEHHVNQNPVEHFGWGGEKKMMNITQSYSLFNKLRNAGIRAHSWV